MNRRLILSCLFLLSLPAFGKSTAHLLGPTGMMGNFGGKDIKVSKVDKESPADGKVKPGDVIIGCFEKKFQNHPRQDLTLAINRAEAADGKLPLMLKGNRTAELQLKPLGAFSDTAPYDCKKTDALVTEIANNVMNSGDLPKDQLGIGWLGLMATGDKIHLDYVKEHLPKTKWANPVRADLMAIINGEKPSGYVGWNWGYHLITLGEYTLLTGDRSLLPAMETYALALSRGQDAAGIWGHRMTSPERNGRLPGYSHINQPSLCCFIGLVLAKLAGVDSPEVAEAIENCRHFYHLFVGKGTIPYGVHDPNSRGYNNNGMSGSSAVAMSLLQDRDSAEFFSRQAANGYNSLDKGHASHFFNPLWTPLGTNVSGPEMTKEFFDRSAWLFTLWRSWNGRFTYDGAKHKALTPDTPLLLAYCVPRKKLVITGRNADADSWLNAARAREVLDYSKIDVNSMKANELIALFGHEAPQVRRAASWNLRAKEGDIGGMAEKMLQEGAKLEKISALGFFGYQCPPELALPRLKLMGSIMADPNENMEVRAAAADSLCCHSPQSHEYYEDMLKLMLEPKPDARYGMLDKRIGRSLTIMSKNPFEDGLVQDKDLFYQAVQKLSENPRQEARGSSMTLLLHMPKEDFPRMADQVKHVALNRDQSYHSYHNPQSTLLPASRLLARLGIKEGPGWALQTMATKDGKHSFKVKAVVGVLEAYGSNAGETIEKVKTDADLMKMLSGGRWAKSWQAAVKAYENKAPAPLLVEFEQAKMGNFPH